MQKKQQKKPTPPLLDPVADPDTPLAPKTGTTAGDRLSETQLTLSRKKKAHAPSRLRHSTRLLWCGTDDLLGVSLFPLVTLTEREGKGLEHSEMCPVRPLLWIWEEL